MINFYDSQITDILPAILTETADVQALSYALQKANQKLQDYTKRARTYAAVAELPDNILDILAVELRSQYYDETLPIETKRSLVANTLVWYSIAGTPYAVEELVATLFGKGRVIEWFDFEGGAGTPGTFMIETTAALRDDILTKLNTMIGKIKNTRSHLIKINVLSDIESRQYFASGVVTVPKYIIKDNG